MMLYINARDINYVSIALFNEEKIVFLESEVQAEPEDHLGCIDRVMRSQNISIQDIDQIMTVVGPGSATALRSILSIVNTLIFVTKIELLGIEWQDKDTDELVINEIRKGKRMFIQEDYFLSPVYAHEPRITLSKKDHLKR